MVRRRCCTSSLWFGNLALVAARLGNSSCRSLSGRDRRSWPLGHRFRPPLEATTATGRSRGKIIWLVNRDPTVGSEIRKTRPCVVVSPAGMHDHLRTVIVAPMTTKSNSAPFRIGILHGGKKGLILMDQMRAVDKDRLAKKLGGVSAKTLSATLNILQEVFTE
jgi:mRNA interferase MazF